MTGEQAESLSVEPVDNYVLLDNRIPGYIDSAFDFSMSGDFETATISFEFDAALLENENFVPRIYYFNEETQVLEELPNQVVQGNVVSVETTHFSKYILLNKTAFDIAWENDIPLPDDDGTQEITGIDVVIATDSSGNMTTSDPLRKRVVFSWQFVDKLGTNDRAAVGDFFWLGMYRLGFTNDRNELKSALNPPNDTGSCDLSSAMQVIIGYFSNREDEPYTCTDAKKCGLILTDGRGTYDSKYTTMAAENGIEVYTVGFGSSINEEVLKGIASGTGGQYYKYSDSMSVNKLYENMMNGVGTGTGTGGSGTIDSNHDGISDYYTRLICDGEITSGTGMNLFAGVSYEALQANDDYDGDGIKNGDEAVLSFRELDNSPYICYVSDPCKKDGDGDGYSDYLELYTYRSDPLISDVRSYMLSNDFISIEGSYGGDQDWFVDDTIDSQDYRIHHYGCGLISPSDVLIYLYMQNPKYETDALHLLEFDASGNITKESYMAFIRYMEENYFQVIEDLELGVLGPMISYGITKYSSDYSLDLNSSWLGTTRLLPIMRDVVLEPKAIAAEMLIAIQEYYGTEITSRKNLKSEIKYMLSNDIPVTLSIGPTYESYGKVGETESIFSLGSIKAVLFYKLDGTYEKPYRLITDYEYPVQSHYVTVTGMIVDNVLDQTILEISSWGHKYYINYNEYIYFIERYNNYVFSNINFIYKE